MPEPATGRPWLNAVGGLGDTLMLSGVLKHVVDRDPTRTFRLVARTKYPPILEGHPAIVGVGHPPPDAEIQRTDYWRHESFGPPAQRAYQVLARMFGLATPVPETLYVPWPLDAEDAVLDAVIPWQRHNVLLGPTSDSPRKELSPHRWEELVTALRADGALVVQAGRRHDPYIRGCFSLLGLTTPRQIVQLMRHFDAVVTADNFLMHGAHLAGRPAVVVWGPTDHRTYGYAGHVHLQAARCDDTECIAPESGHLYGTPCPKPDARCVDTLPLEHLYAAVRAVLEGARVG